MYAHNSNSALRLACLVYKCIVCDITHRYTRADAGWHASHFYKQQHLESCRDWYSTHIRKIAFVSEWGMMLIFGDVLFIYAWMINASIYDLFVDINSNECCYEKVARNHRCVIFACHDVGVCHYAFISITFFLRHCSSCYCDANFDSHSCIVLTE